MELLTGAHKQWKASNDFYVRRERDHHSIHLIQHMVKGIFFPKVSVLDEWSDKRKKLTRQVLTFTNVLVIDYSLTGEGDFELVTFSFDEYKNLLI